MNRLAFIAATVALLRLGGIDVQAAPLEASRLGMTVPAMVTYLNGMRRVLSPEDLESQAFFLESAGRAPKGSARAIEIPECLADLHARQYLPWARRM